MHGVVLCCIVVAFLCGWYKEKRDVESKILSCSLHVVCILQIPAP